MKEEEEEGSTGILNPGELIKVSREETLLYHHCQLHSILSCRSGGACRTPSSIHIPFKCFLPFSYPSPFLSILLSFHLLMQVNTGHPILLEEGAETWFLLSLPCQGCRELFRCSGKAPDLFCEG